MKVQFVVQESKSQNSPPDETAHPPNNTTRDEAVIWESMLNPKYTFDTFVVGNSNQFASAAALAVASRPAHAYNPLFIYGGVGLGKTHLMHAIGNLVLKTNKRTRVMYVPTEKFTYELISSLGDHQILKFKKKYRNVDVLLVDDIQFLINKERTQEEFFYTFNALYEANKQIVITSDRPPREIPTLEERLRSRFEMGLLADIQTPDLETRQAILKKKAELEGVEVPFDVISYIAENIHSNIRELEGALIHVIASASFTNGRIDMELAKRSLMSIMPNTKGKPVTVKSIQEKVAEYFAIRLDDLVGERRDQRFALPRQIAMYLSRELTNLSYPDIGREFGGKDHSTVMHACRKISSILNEPNIKNSIENIRNLLKNG